MTARPRRPWRRWLRRAAVSLLLGAVTTVGVAWFFAAYSLHLSEPRKDFDNRTYWSLSVFSLGRQIATDLEWSRRVDPGGAEWDVPTETRWYGWPRPALRSRAERPAAAGTVWFPAGTAPQPAFPLAATGGEDRALTARQLIGGGISTAKLPAWLGASKEDRLAFLPVWPGFAINASLFAALWWITLAAPGLPRRWARRQRGLCVTCGYDLRGLAPGEGGASRCPECGTQNRRA